ncbi:MAG: diadenylate cyclase CdaA [Ruminococcus sp.]|nr:diadenylate cyclase CdaA [Ruminococcus sp.]
MMSISEVFQSIWNILVSIRITDIIDMALLSYLIYHGIRLVRETRAQQLVKGIIVLVAAYLIAFIANLQTMRFILKNCFQWGFLAIIILFQPELRRIIERIGRTRFTEIGSIFTQNEPDEINEHWLNAIDAICDAAQDLSSTCTGALIICEQKTRLGEQIATGTILNCTPSAAVFGNIFFPNTPLHDGAVIMRDGMILAAGCFLPKPQKEELIAKQLGSRHRAAIGMSENSDAIVIVVSEETGKISVAENGELTRGYSKESLKKLLITRLIHEQDKTTSGKDKNSFAGRVLSKWKK